MSDEFDEEDGPVSQPVTETTRLKKGDPVWILWGNSWWQGNVVTAYKNGKVKIHYDGYDASSDEVVTRDRLYLGGPPEGAATAGAGGGAAKSGPPAVYDNPLQGRIFGKPIYANTSLNTGDEVLVLWGTSWWAGSVLETLDDGKVKIHYTDWDSSWDEVVTRQRLRFPGVGRRTVTVYLERDWSLTADLIEITADSLVLKMFDSNREAVISRLRVVYFEIHEDD